MFFFMLQAILFVCIVLYCFVLFCIVWFFTSCIDRWSIQRIMKDHRLIKFDHTITLPHGLERLTSLCVTAKWPHHDLVEGKQGQKIGAIQRKMGAIQRKSDLYNENGAICRNTDSRTAQRCMARRVILLQKYDKNKNTQDLLIILILSYFLVHCKKL